MNLKRFFLTVMLALGLLLPSVAGAAESIQRSTDEKGTIQIRTGGAAEKEKAGEKDGNLMGPAELAAPGQASSGGQAPPGLLPRHSRRSYGPAAEARQKAFEQAHPNLISPSVETQPNLTPAPSEVKAPPAPAPKAPAVQPESPPVPESR